MELVRLDLSDSATASQLLALQRRAYQVEAEVDVIPGLRVARFRKRLS